MSNLGAISSMSIRNPLSKRIFDLVFGTLALLLALPLMAVIVLIIIIEQRQNPIFTQRRTGLGGSEFTIYKFRTMTESLEDKDRHDKPLFVGRHDPKITWLGKLLRNTSIDELPQLFNVLKGDMSLVGPRPQPLNHLNYYSSKIKNYRERLSMKPGITGLVQITPLRYEVDTVSKFAIRANYDAYYVRNWSLRFDVWICWKTVQVVFNPNIIAEQGRYFGQLRSIAEQAEKLSKDIPLS